MDKTNRPIKTRVWNLVRIGLVILPWILLIILAYQAVFSPRRGVIGPIELPAHDGFLPDEGVQWWYWTGHLHAESDDGEARDFGLEVCFFSFNKFGGLMRDILTQAAITDIADNSYHFKEYLRLTLPPKLVNSFLLTSGPSEEVRAAGGGGVDELHLELEEYRLDLHLETSDSHWLHYAGNPHPFKFGGYTYYYSRPNMKTTGTLSIGEKEYRISGLTWFDRQYGDLLLAIMNGWQWFGIILDDGTNIMLFDFVGKENRIERFGSVLYPDGKSRHMGSDDFSVEVLGHWTSPDTGCRYPAGWSVMIDDKVLEIRPKVTGQELRANHGLWVGPEYWEGTCSVEGTHSGNAYVELNGYCNSIEGDIDLD